MDSQPPPRSASSAALKRNSSKHFVVAAARPHHGRNLSYGRGLNKLGKITQADDSTASSLKKSKSTELFVRRGSSLALTKSTRNLSKRPAAKKKKESDESDEEDVLSIKVAPRNSILNADRQDADQAASIALAGSVDPQISSSSAPTSGTPSLLSSPTKIETEMATPESVDSNSAMRSRFIDDGRESRAPSDQPTTPRRSLVTDEEASAAAEAAAAAAVAAVASAGSFPISGGASLTDVAAAAAAAGGSRTQQRMWLQRASMHDEAEEDETRRRASVTSRRSGEQVDSLSKEVKNVKRYRDPVVESLERVRLRVMAASVGFGAAVTGAKSKWLFAGGDADEAFAAALVSTHDSSDVRYNDRRGPNQAEIALALQKMWSGRWRVVDDTPAAANTVGPYRN